MKNIVCNIFAKKILRVVIIKAFSKKKQKTIIHYEGIIEGWDYECSRVLSFSPQVKLKKKPVHTLSILSYGDSNHFWVITTIFGNQSTHNGCGGQNQSGCLHFPAPDTQFKST